MRNKFLENVIYLFGLGVVTSLSDTSTETASGSQGILDSSTETNQILGTTDGCTENPFVSSSAAGIIVAGGYSTSTSADNGPDFEGDIGGIKFKGFFRDSVPYTRVEKRAQKVSRAVNRHKISFQKPIFISKNKETSLYMQAVFGNPKKHFDYDTLIIIERFLEECTYE